MEQQVKGRRFFTLLIGAFLLFDSGLCGLIYQLTWMRQLRFVFGVTTAAIGAVTAAFMIGLGAGALFFGIRAETSPNPLRMYAKLEFFITISALLTIPLLPMIERAYYLTGGTQGVGVIIATIIRMLLATVVVGLPAFLMGGTLPAMSRAFTPEGDRRRVYTAVLYGTNTLGAVSGALLVTYRLHELFGQRWTLLFGAAVNVIVVIAAFILSRDLRFRDTKGERNGPAPRRTCIAAASVGFTFFLMELIWYRMLTPLLGGTVYTFGTILAVALLGIGVGGLFYVLWGRPHRSPSRFFMMACALEAFFLAAPFALGDRLPAFALTLRGNSLSLFWQWMILTSIVVLPASITAGVQFPALIATLGEGKRNVARQVGTVYFWNTLGALAGSWAGGFGLLPLFSAPGAWKFAVALQAAVPLLFVGSQSESRRWTFGFLAVPLLFFLAKGPTAAWRHDAVGAHSVRLSKDGSAAWDRHVQAINESLLYEEEGIESSVAILGFNDQEGPALMINGRSDGSARGDAATQIMLGLTGAIFHAPPADSLVIGFGTGSTAGWLGRVPGIGKLDVVELEPAVIRASKFFTPVNQDVLANPKVKLHLGDARETLLTSAARYDLIISEPSTLYRAGIAGLFTKDFYTLAASHLKEDGFFVQWLQAYEVDEAIVRGIFATLLSVFPNLEIWETKEADLLLVNSFRPIPYDVPMIRKKLGTEPFRSGTEFAWRASSLEGLFSRRIGGTATAKAFVSEEPLRVNTDDRMWIEFFAAKTLATVGSFRVTDLRSIARALNDDRPPVMNGSVDWAKAEDQRASTQILDGVTPYAPPTAETGFQHRTAAKANYLAANLLGALHEWKMQSQPPDDSLELALLAEATAQAGEPTAEAWIDRLKESEQVEADAILSVLRWKQGKKEESERLLLSSLRGLQESPWPYTPLLKRVFLEMISKIANNDTASAARLRLILKIPFSVGLLDRTRSNLLSGLAH